MHPSATSSLTPIGQLGPDPNDEVWLGLGVAHEKIAELPGITWVK